MTKKQEFGEFLNPSPIHCEWQHQHSWCFFWKVDEWIYYADPINPLTYVAPDGTEMRPNKKFYTDFGSIPPPLMALPSLGRTRFIHTYLFHDDACRHGGLWWKKPGKSIFIFQSMSRDESDEWIKLWVGADGGNAWQRQIIYRGVRIGAHYK